jgi:hypothetical protein
VDIITVVLIHNEEVTVAQYTGGYKTSGGVDVKHAHGGVASRIQVKRSTCRKAPAVMHHPLPQPRIPNLWFVAVWYLQENDMRMGGSNIGVLRVQVSFVYDSVLLWLLAYLSRGEALPCCKVACVDGITPCGKRWREQAGVVEGDAVGDGVVVEGGVDGSNNDGVGTVGAWMAW